MSEIKYEVGWRKCVEYDSNSGDKGNLKKRSVDELKTRTGEKSEYGVVATRASSHPSTLAMTVDPAN